ncbi:hypothetical protein, unlikely [Trypanosoma brucei gambiense DAL972]|uniref:Uncharacterized protein n=1 Tax=Trypanosoma brucei gambiense (strain MHOM/CI/86/DAL972) TaxID=679716 RepID=C9ZNF3_TRYB9|nr:hypothetical protein, unlikely [Trypanosoma brucei gambiense DAL972]CBH10931.1 hypothetical protein, unlikely [Trypanosoma brucei gambiense DAL972]|eukprot:XP_011773218.1 hypothetical protein, unlikely [Trypanosoma brucei gambiense DAL972]
MLDGMDLLPSLDHVVPLPTLPLAPPSGLSLFARLEDKCESISRLLSHLLRGLPILLHLSTPQIAPRRIVTRDPIFVVMGTILCTQLKNCSGDVSVMYSTSPSNVRIFSSGRKPLSTKLFFNR